MDLSTALLGLTFAVVSAFVVYFISVTFIKEKTYDEVKAEQKKKAEEYLAQGRTAKEKAKDKKLKKAGKKVKEKTTSESVELSSSDEVDRAKSHVAFAETPEVVEEPPLVVEEPKKKKNKKKEKLNLVGKQETSPVNVQLDASIPNHFEHVVSKHIISGGDIEPIPKPNEPPTATQKQSSGNKSAKTQVKEQPKEVKSEKVVVQKQAQQPPKPTEKAATIKTNDNPSSKPKDKNIPSKPVEEVALKASIKHVQGNSIELSPSTKNIRKKRSELSTLHQMSGDKDAVNVNCIMPLVLKAELSRTEIQLLIDVLLNKQQGSSIQSAEWIEGRQDPVVKLKKQLAEKEKALSEEQDAAAALQSKLKELRQELNAEKHSSRQMEGELASVVKRLQATGDEKQAFVLQIQQLQGKLSEEHMLLCKLQEDQSQTQGALQQELLAQRQQLEMHIARLTEQHQETVAALESQLQQMAGQLQEQEAVNTQLSGELNLARDSRQIKELHSEMERMKSKSQYDISRLQNEVSSLTEQLNIKRSENEKMNNLVQNLQTENSRLALQISSACVEAQRLRDDNESLAAQVTASMERPATEGRENGDLSFAETKTHQDNNLDKLHENEVLLEKLRSDIVSKEKEISHHKTELAKHETLLNSLKLDLNTAHSNSEKMLEEIKSYKSLNWEQERIISSLREERDAALKSVNTLRGDLNKRQAELQHLNKDFVNREQLENREATIEKLTSELNTHKTKLADQQALVKSFELEIVSLKDSIGKNSNQEALATQIASCKDQILEKEATIKSLSDQVNKYETELKTLQNDLTSAKLQMSKYSQEIKDHVNKEALLVQDLEAQKSKNDELRTKNWKVMEALSTTEKTLETKVKESHKLITEAEKNARLEEHEKTKKILSRVLPHIPVDDKQDYEVWLERFLACARESSSRSVGDSREGEMLAEVEQQNCQLQAMVTHYKSIIADTEGMLNRLQSHVEQEENRWGQQIHLLESQLEAITQERDRLEAISKNGALTTDVGSEAN